MDVLNSTIDFFRRFLSSDNKKGQDNSVSVSKSHMSPPQSLVIFLTSECNMRCKQCYMWMNKDENILSLEERIELVKDFHKLNPNGNVTLIGGEPMLKEEEFFTLFKLCRKLNLKTGVETNGSLINESHYEKLILEGPNVLGISLDSHIDSIHDNLRGVKGSCSQLKETLKNLAAYKKSKYSNEDFKLFTTSILFDKNIGFINDYIQFARDIGLDGVIFLPLFPTFGNKKRDKDVFYDQNFFKDKELTVKIFDDLANRTITDKFLYNTYEEFKWMGFYAQHPNDFEEALEEPICDSHSKRIIVNYNGEYELCGNMKGIEGIKESIGNAKNISLKEVWESSKTKSARAIMDECKLPCGIIFCNNRKR